IFGVCGKLRLSCAQVLFAERSHLSGVSVSVRLAPGSEKSGELTISLHEGNENGQRALRTARVAMATLESGEPEPLYWVPVKKSKGRFFILSAWVSGNDARPRVKRSLELDMKFIFSPPEGYESLPQAILFSPVSQCNLNCTHCISRPTRARTQFA